MKKIIVVVLLALLGFVLSHIIISYGVWDLNPKNWSSDLRGIAAFLGAILMGVGMAAGFEITKNWNK